MARSASSPHDAVGAETREPVGRARSRRASGRLSKDAYRRQKTSIEGDLTRLGLRKSQLELALLDRSVQSNFIELRRIGSELADVTSRLDEVEEAWLMLEERAPR